uniref:glucuronosyltransferase n=1 Tax=Meloidogyne floridensis TaxID=298350 RepID=A0A915PGF8_9BILA
MWNFFKGRKKEAEQLPLLSQQYYDEGSSSSSIQSNQQTPTKTSNGKRILLVTEAKPPHNSFFVNLANVLCYNGNYDVFLFVVKYNENELNKPLEGVRYIEVPYKKDKEYSKEFNSKKHKTNWKREYDINVDHPLKSLELSMFTIYKAIIENPKVAIFGMKQGVFNWLRNMGIRGYFELGIAEFSSGGVHLLAEIKLEKYLIANSKIPFPIHFHSLEDELHRLMPELNYQEISEQNEVEYLNLARKRAIKDNLLGNHKLIKVEEMPKMWDLLRKSKYYLINVHPLGQFPFPNIPKRIVNIGGIEVEIEGILNEIEDEKKSKEKKSTANDLYKNITKKVNYKDCKFVAQFPTNYYEQMLGYNKDDDTSLKLNYYVESNVYISAQKNLHAFITAGDQECFNEALYAGVPLILIPFTLEQKFNAKIVKYMKVGTVVDHKEFLDQFPAAILKLIRIHLK